MADNIQATPRNYVGGLLTDAYKWMQSPERTQQMQGFAGLLGTTGLPQTVERMAYGEPLTNISRANVPLLKPETADALMTVAPFAGPAARGSSQLARGVGRLAGGAVNDAMVYGRGPLASITPQPMRMVDETAGLIGQPAKSASTLPTDYYELNGMATQAYADLRAKPSQEAADYYKSIMKARDEAANNPSNNYTPPAPDIVPQDYKGQHQAPTKDGGAPLWDMKGIYPDDFYGPQGAQYYGDGADTARDSMIVRQMQSMKDRPNAPVTIYRAVPKSVPTKEALNTGDWITLDRRYAKEHGEGALNGDYKIVSKTVKARDLFTNGDSIYEMGYDPQPRVKKAVGGLLD